MVAFKAHFDGKSLIFDEPVDLPRNEPLIVQVQPANQQRPPTNFDDWIGIANQAPEDPNARVKTEDEVWMDPKDFSTWLGAALRGPQNPNPDTATDDELWED